MVIDTSAPPAILVADDGLRQPLRRRKGERIVCAAGLSVEPPA